MPNFALPTELGGNEGLQELRIFASVDPLMHGDRVA
jgi:hypothetical protein